MFNDLSELSNVQSGGNVFGEASKSAKGIMKDAPIKFLLSILIGGLIGASIAYFTAWKKAYRKVFDRTKNKAAAGAAAVAASAVTFAIAGGIASLITFFVLAILEDVGKSPGGAFALGMAVR